MSQVSLEFANFYVADEIQKQFVKEVLQSTGVPEKIIYSDSNSAFDLNQRLVIQYINMVSFAFTSIQNSYANKKIVYPLLPQFRKLFDILKLDDIDSIKFINNAISKNEQLLNEITLKNQLKQNFDNFCNAITFQYNSANPDLVKFTEEVLGIKNFAVVEFNRLFDQFLLDVITSAGRCVPQDVCSQDQYINGFNAIMNVVFSEAIAPLMKEWEIHTTQSSKFIRSLVFEANNNLALKNKIKKLLESQ